jgi:hypothetical protein
MAWSLGDRSTLDSQRPSLLNFFRPQAAGQHGAAMASPFHRSNMGATTDIGAKIYDIELDVTSAAQLCQHSIYLVVIAYDAELCYFGVISYTSTKRSKNDIKFS